MRRRQPRPRANTVVVWTSSFLVSLSVSVLAPKMRHTHDVPVLGKVTGSCTEEEELHGKFNDIDDEGRDHLHKLENAKALRGTKHSSEAEVGKVSAWPT